jgi:mono/diheme cytochrome c family protein
MKVRGIDKKAGVAILALALLVLAGTASCVSDSVEELENTATCDTLNVTYNGRIKALLGQNCTGCHSTTSASGGVQLDTYQKAKTYGQNGQLYGTMAHINGYVPMPYNQPKLSQCDIAKVYHWIANGCPE